MSAIPATVSEQQLHTWLGLNWKPVCSERVESLVKEVKGLQGGLSCFSSRYWVVSTDPAVLSATGSPVSQCLSSSDGSQLRPPSWSRILKRDIITIWPWIINVAKLSTNLTLKLLSHVLRPTAANLAWLLSTAQRSSVEKSELMKARVEEF